LRVALFATCLADNFFAEACADAVRLLRHLGVEVDFPEGQSCCGQPAYNAGYVVDAKRMVCHTMEVFEDAEYIVLPSGSCAGMIRTLYPRLGNVEQANRMGGRTFELSEFLVNVLKVDSLGNGLEGMSVAYHHGCHALRELGVETEPVQLLRESGATVLEWEADKECCGFGGLFSTKLPEVSGAMADRKLDTLPDVDLVTSTDGGCLLQLAGRAEKKGSTTPFRHLASILWQGVDGKVPEGREKDEHT
jgi:L-lactate dehydrogenase complex protein LldE